MDIADICITSHPTNTKEYTFFSVPHGTFSKIDHILSKKNQTSTESIKIEITPYILSDHVR